MTQTYDEILGYLASVANPDSVQGMARYGIRPARPLGVSIPRLRQLARDLGRDHLLAQQLWVSGFHEARILAAFIEDASQVSEKQMEDWVGDFDSWDICDQVCSNLFVKTAFAYRKAEEWSGRPEEFVRRAGFVLMASLAVHDKRAPNARLAAFLPIIEIGAADERNFVRKAVNWALRQIGKRNTELNRASIAAAESILESRVRSSRWVAMDALRELRSDAVQNRLALH
jgi:3-methyladenine DNA glycosylase AlkD